MQDYDEADVIEGYEAMCDDPHKRIERMMEENEKEVEEFPRQPFKGKVTQEQRQIEVIIIAKDPIDLLDLIHACCNCVKYKMNAVPKWDAPIRASEEVPP